MEVRTQMMTRITEIEALNEVYQSARYQSLKKLILGGGSNVLFTRNFLGMILRMEISGIEVVKEDDQSMIVSFGAGENWHQSVLWAVNQGLGGIENLALIPGTIGAAPMQNIGAYGVEIKDVFHSLEAYEIETGEVVKFYHEDCKFGYRYSVFKSSHKNKYVITKVNLKLSKKPEYNITYGNIKSTLEQMGVEELSPQVISQAVMNIRQSKLPDPMVIGNAGSFFKNPIIENEYFDALRAAFEDIPGYRLDGKFTKVPAAWLIDQCGWKGYRDGDIGVHDKQALVLVNHGKGQGQEILMLSQRIQESVYKKFGVEIDPEVNIIS